MIPAPLALGIEDGSGSARWVFSKIGFLGWMLHFREWKLRERKSEDSEEDEGDKRARRREGGERGERREMLPLRRKMKKLEMREKL